MISSVDATVDALRIALGRASRQSEVVASNLANLDTPGYRAMEVRFRDLLDMARDPETTVTDRIDLERRRKEQVRGTVVEAPITRMRNDGNTVDVDREMTLLARAQGRYRVSAEMLRKRFGLLTYAATDGRGGV